MAHSSSASKPTKPRPDFPLFPHRNGFWAKKVRGKHEYFGRIADDADGAKALIAWLDAKEDLLAGRKRRGTRQGLEMLELCNRFMAAKEDQRDAGDITSRTYEDYYATARLVLAAFGQKRLVEDLDTADFGDLRKQLAKTRNPNSLGNEVQRIRTLFKFGYDVGIIKAPVRFGPVFKRPAKMVLRRERQKKGKRLFEARQIRRMLKTAPPQLRAMVLLGINCGMGNNDCGSLPQSAIDFKGGWIDFPRPKTAIDRRLPLWPETVASLQAAIAVRPKAKDPVDDALAFITRRGGRWSKETADSPVSKEFRKMLDALRLYRPGLSFYALRHTFETVAGGCKDQVAVDAVMGHVDGTMAGEYREEISDGRLRAAADHVRRWLFRRESTTPWRAGEPKSR